MEEEESDIEELDIWTLPRKSTNKNLAIFSQQCKESFEVNKQILTSASGVHEVADGKKRISDDAVKKKFESLKKRCVIMRTNVEACQKKTEARRDRKKLKAKSEASSVLEENNSEESKTDEQKWQEIKPFLTINDHLSGPVPHGNCGPKTELEMLVDEAIKEGDFEKAEILSDNLADRKFAVKIKDAFAAKRCAEQKAEEEAMKKAKQLKKLHWTFETKQRWEMKSNM